MAVSGVRRGGCGAEGCQRPIAAVPGAGCAVLGWRCPRRDGRRRGRRGQGHASVHRPGPAGERGLGHGDAVDALAPPLRCCRELKILFLTQI
jgi:hypothetical protein